ncbi:putative ABC transporter ATP-binding protein [Pirellula sp. SH-Sr6A]|nr:putative ABC transporter ATP-binding protein [Pirellula sp. SH-Sr6A]
MAASDLRRAWSSTAQRSPQTAWNSGHRHDSPRFGTGIERRVECPTMDTSLLDMASDAVFRVRGVTKVYPMGEVSVHALRGVDLDLFAGEFVVILGASGSGKSTLLNILGGLDVPTSGSVHFRDHDLTQSDESERTLFRRDHVGFVFQFYNLIAGLTAFENVALVADIAKNPLPPIEALRLVGLEERRDHYPSQLSGGEQQRIAIARAIGKRPDVLLCDEPTGALDVRTGVIVLEAIANVNRQLGTLTVVITHNASIAQMADRVISMTDGRISAIERNANQIPASQLVW